MINLNSYLDSKKIVFARVIDLPDYTNSEADTESLLNSNNAYGYDGVYEIENFLVRNKKVTGFVETNYVKDNPKRINIEKIDSNYKDEDFLDNCLVIFITLKTSEVMGIYMNARVFRNRQIDNVDYTNQNPGFFKQIGPVQYYFEASENDAILFPKEYRISLNNIIGSGLNFGQSNVKYLDDVNLKYTRKLLKVISEKFNDYLCFHVLLNFWVKHTDNNIDGFNSGKRVRNKEIKPTSDSSIKKLYNNPEFKDEYLRYTNFDVGISFFRNGSYKGINVNFIYAIADQESSKVPSSSWWTNIRYNKDRNTITANYLASENNDDKPDLKEFMINKKYDKGFTVSLNDLKLELAYPTSESYALFDYYSQMIADLNFYTRQKGNNEMKYVVKRTLENNKNIILRGAPGTGKTFLAKQIASEIIGVDVAELNDSEQFGFVQFHPSYDYTDFVEGLRPFAKGGEIGFELKAGIFYDFCETAKYNSVLTNNNITSFDLESFKKFLEQLGGNQAINYIPIIEQLLGLKPYTGSKTDNFPTYSNLTDLLDHYEEIKDFDVKHVFRGWLSTPLNRLRDFKNQLSNNKQSSTKKYVFIIDEINRGEISKIFGELFFSIDPNYRGNLGAVKTQYSNLHECGNEYFYIPENVYIIGTMNDIDRSVDTFDFAMRRRFSFIELTAEYSQIMLSKPDTIVRMNRVNQSIIDREIGNLSNEYMIGASYFKSIEDGIHTVEELWDYKLEPLIKDYFIGERDSEKKLCDIKASYFGETTDAFKD